MNWMLIGNSHVDQFHIHDSDIIKRYCKMGASIKGLTNPNSTLHLHDDIQTFLRESPTMGLAFFLGQVDLDFGYYYKCVIDDRKYPIEEYIDDLISRYISYLVKLPTKTCTITINPTTILDMKHTYNVCFKEDNGKNGQYSSIIDIPFETVHDKYLNDSYETRMSYCEQFNNRLQSACQVAGIPCINLWDDIVVDGKVRPEYMPTHTDHHLRVSNTVPLRESLLNQLRSLSFP